MTLVQHENDNSIKCDGIRKQGFESMIDWRGKVTSQIDLEHHQFLLASKSFSNHSLVTESARRFRRRKLLSGSQPQTQPITEVGTLAAVTFEAKETEKWKDVKPEHSATISEQPLAYVDLLGPRFHWPAPPASNGGSERLYTARPRSAASLSRPTTAQRRHQQQQNAQRLLQQPSLSTMAALPRRPATAAITGGAASLAARAQSALRQRTTPSIPFNRGSGGGGGGGPAFRAEFEYHARLLTNCKDFISHVHGLRRGEVQQPQATARDNEQQSGAQCDRSSEPNFRLIGSRIASECPTRCASAHSAKSTARMVIKAPASKTAPAAAGRPIPEDFKIANPDEEAAKLDRWQKAVENVDIQKIFGHPYLAPDHAKKFDSDIAELALRERIAAMKIQRAFRRHLQRKRLIESRPVSAKTDWTENYDRQLKVSATSRLCKLAEKRSETAEHAASMESKLEVIGPHVEVYQSFHPPRFGPTPRQRHIAAVIIQKTLRGYLVRRFLKRLTAKARLHGFPNLKEFLGYYYALIRRIVRSATGASKRAEVRFDMDQLDQFMEDKRRLEIGFDATSFEGDLSERDLMKLFNMCGFFPAHREVSDTLEAFHSRRGVKVATATAAATKTLTKSDAVEIFFHIFKPAGTGIQNDRRSTWMHPIVNGEDAAKYVTPEELPPTPLTQCIRLVAASKLDRLPFEKQVDLRRHLRQLDKMEQLLQERKQKESAISRSRGGSAARSRGPQRRVSAAPEAAAVPAPVKLKIHWMKD